MDSSVSLQDDERPLIAHVIYRLDVGGLENGLINLINHLPHDSVRHAIICIDRSSDFQQRIQRSDVQVIEIRKKPGRDIGASWRIFKALRRLRPRIVHTRNIGALDAIIPAIFARVHLRVHGEHGWNIDDLAGTNRKYRWIRRFYAPFITKYVSVSRELEEFLVGEIGIARHRIKTICNGVNVNQFRPEANAVIFRENQDSIFSGAECVFGAVGRMDPVKNHLWLLDSFAMLIDRLGESGKVRLVIVGDGELYPKLAKRSSELNLDQLVWLPGRRQDIKDILNCFDVFVQPSIAEGISNTVLEAMACALPVVATGVGGNKELVEHEVSGTLIDVDDENSLVSCMFRYAIDPELRTSHGKAARRRTELEFSIDKMVEAYSTLYEEVLDTWPAR